MIKNLSIFTLILLSFNAFSQNNKDSRQFSKISDDYLNKVVSSIYIIEGGNKTKYPFGVRSINTDRDYEKAKRICSNTVSNQFIRWQKWGKTNSFEESLAKRYCPVGANDDPTGLNKHWLGNLRRELARTQQR